MFFFFFVFFLFTFCYYILFVFFFFFKQKTAYEIMPSLVGSEMCIRDRTHSRPHVSNDNPYSESQFRTMKYRPEFPDRFGSLQDSRVFGQRFFSWYNEEHRHSGLGLLTPAMVHHGQV